MAKYKVEYSCGHAIEKQLFGKHDDRRRYIEWAAKSGQCGKCKAKRENAQLAVSASAMNLPALSGSEKQIAWAGKIRLQMIETIRRVTDIDNLDPRSRSMFDELKGKTEARWWIDRRDVVSTDKIFALLRSLEPAA